jgi:D-3-phosphoglycerate dehydrogenase
MKPGAILINTARGAIVDETAMIEALRVGAIAGAGLDVFVEEPPALDNPLFSFENVVATPHIGANTDESLYRMSLNAAMEIERVLTGQKPLWPVVNL